MSCCSWLSVKIPKALPSLIPPSYRSKDPPFPGYISCHQPPPTSGQQPQPQQQQQQANRNRGDSTATILGVLSTVAVAAAQPAIAVTGVNYEEDLTWVLIQLGISAFLYFIVVPPIIMNWLWRRWYKRNLLEMYLQFMFVFMFYPGMLLWAPFLNFRKFPRDPSMKYPWSTPQNPSQIKGGFLKYPWAQPEDYE